MGQYHRIMNLTRCEFIEPTAFAEGQKITEFGLNGGGAMAALSALLSATSGRGFGDFHCENGVGRDDPEQWLNGFDLTAALAKRHIVGRWRGDEIAIVGDYFRNDDLSDWGDGGAGGAWGNDCGKWQDVSWLGLVAIGLDSEARPFAAANLSATNGLDGALVCPRPTDFVLFEGTATAL